MFDLSGCSARHTISSFYGENAGSGGDFLLVQPDLVAIGVECDREVARRKFHGLESELYPGGLHFGDRFGQAGDLKNDRRALRAGLPFVAEAVGDREAAVAQL